MTISNMEKIIFFGISTNSYLFYKNTHTHPLVAISQYVQKLYLYFHVINFLCGHSLTIAKLNPMLVALAVLVNTNIIPNIDEKAEIYDINLGVIGALSTFSNQYLIIPKEKYQDLLQKNSRR